MQPSLVGRYTFVVGGALFAAMLGACTDEATSDVAQETAGSGVAGVIVGVGQLGPAELEIKWDGHVAKIEGPVTLTQQEITFQPGGHTGWHTHGGVALVTIVSGALTLFDSHHPCEGTTYSAGSAFMDPGGGHTHIGRNLTSGATVVRVQYINPTGTAIRVDAPAPAGSELCP